jgi:hypothetical protein
MAYDVGVLPEVLGAALAVLVTALPPPPEKVVRQTKSYGTVTFDHKAHLARRVSCRVCHVSGPITTRVKYTPRSGHDACRGCHVQVAKGPTDCKGCHTLPPKTVVAAAAPAVVPAKLTRTVATFDGPPLGPHELGRFIAPPDGGDPAEAYGKSVELGLATVVGERQGLIAGPAVQLLARTGRTVITYSLAFMGSRDHGRTQFLVGGGRSFPLGRRVRGTAVALGGVDATHSPVSTLPALGLRGSVEWLSTRPWTLGFSLTALTDLTRGGSHGETTGGTTVGFGFFAGRPLSR